MRERVRNVGESLQRHAHWLLACFIVSLLVLNWGRWTQWNGAGFLLYLTHPIMQTTLWDFAWVLAILTVLIHQDARKHRLRYWYVLATFPVMPAVGLLLYIWLRYRRLSKSGNVPLPGG